MRLSKQLRVIHWGTPICLIDSNREEIYHGTSKEALEKLGQECENLFVKTIKVDSSPKDAELAIYLKGR